MKKEIIFLIILILVGVGAFYGGIKYQQNKISQRTFFQREGWERTNQLRERIVSGEIILKDEKSLTLKLPDGSTKIVFISDKTKISKMTEGTLEDLEIGKQVMIIGNQTTEGVFLADQIQISPIIFQRR